MRCDAGVVLADGRRLGPETFHERAVRDGTYEAVADGVALRLTIARDATPAGETRVVTVANTGSEPLALAEILPLIGVPEPCARSLDGAALWLHGREMNRGVFTHRFGAEPEHGGFAGRWCEATPSGTRYVSEGAAAVLSTPAGCTLWGFITTARQFGELRVAVSTDERTLLGVECACLLDGYTLAPGESMAAETLLISSGGDPLALIERYADAAAAAMHARASRRVPAGWCSWYSLYNQTSEAAVLANVEALRRERVPVEIVQIDDGYQAATGDWLTPNQRFPSGMAALAGGIRAAGFTPGLWLAPFVLHRDSATLRDHPEWAVHGQDGGIRFIACWLGEVAALDCMHPGARAWLRQVIATMVRDWGCGYLKLDALHFAAQPNARYHAPNTTAAANLRAGLEVIREAAGDETYILGCTCFFGPAIGLVDAMRVGADVETVWFHPARLPSLFNAMRLTLPRWFMHGRWWTNDPDCLLARDMASELTREEVRTLATGIALSGGSVFLGDDVRDLSPERLAIARSLLPPTGVAARPLDLLERETPRLFSAPSWGGRTVAALLNWDDEPHELALLFARLGLDAGPYHVFEFWERLYLGVHRGGVPAERVAPHSPRLYLLTPDTGVPVVVGTAAHTGMGAASIGSERWDAERRTFEITVARNWARPESVYITVPAALREAGLRASGAAALERAGPLLRLDVDPSQGRHFVVEFER